MFHPEYVNGATQVLGFLEGVIARQYLINHPVLENGAFGHNFHGHALSCLGILRELHLSEGSFTNCPPDLILTNLSRCHSREK